MIAKSCSIIAVVLTLFFVDTASAKTIRLSTFPNSAFTVPLVSIMTEIYRRAGFKIEFVYLPSKRALAMSLSGKVNGELGRVYAIGEMYSSLIRV